MKGEKKMSDIADYPIEWEDDEFLPTNEKYKIDLMVEKK